MSKLDSVLSKLPELASKAMPGHKFAFSMSHHAKDNVFQLSMSKDYGHQDGPMFFLSGNGSSTEEAAGMLIAKFIDWTAAQITKEQDELMRVTARQQASVTTLTTLGVEAALLVLE